MSGNFSENVVVNLDEALRKEKEATCCKNFLWQLRRNDPLEVRKSIKMLYNDFQKSTFVRHERLRAYDSADGVSDSPCPSFSMPSSEGKDFCLTSNSVSLVSSAPDVSEKEGSEPIRQPTVSSSNTTAVCSQCILELLNIVATRSTKRSSSGNPLWFDICASIALYFELIVSRQFGDILADLLLSGNLQSGLREDAESCHFVFDDECECIETSGLLPFPILDFTALGPISEEDVVSQLNINSNNYNEEGSTLNSPVIASAESNRLIRREAKLTSFRQAIAALTISIGSNDVICVAAAKILRCFFRIPALHDVFMAYPMANVVLDGGGVDGTTTTQSYVSNAVTQTSETAFIHDSDTLFEDGWSTSSGFGTTHVGAISRFLSSPIIPILSESWETLKCMLLANKPLADCFITYYIKDFTYLAVSCLLSQNHLTKLYVLKLLLDILKDQEFEQFKRHLSVAVFSAVLHLTNEDSLHIQRLTYEVLKEHILLCQTNARLVQMLYINKDNLIRFIDYMGSITPSSSAPLLFERTELINILNIIALLKGKSSEEAS